MVSKLENLSCKPGFSHRWKEKSKEGKEMSAATSKRYRERERERERDLEKDKWVSGVQRCCCKMSQRTMMICASGDPSARHANTFVSSPTIPGYPYPQLDWMDHFDGRQNPTWLPMIQWSVLHHARHLSAHILAVLLTQDMSALTLW
jgi:hypothetical protein